MGVSLTRPPALDLADGFTLADVTLLLGLICEDFPDSLSEAAAAVLRLSSVSQPVRVEVALQAILTLFMYTGERVASLRWGATHDGTASTATFDVF